MHPLNYAYVSLSLSVMAAAGNHVIGVSYTVGNAHLSSHEKNVIPLLCVFELVGSSTNMENETNL